MKEKCIGRRVSVLPQEEEDLILWVLRYYLRRQVFSLELYKTFRNLALCLLPIPYNFLGNLAIAF